jgi:hypothetical protein
MGIPEHYSREIARRCQSLIQHLLPQVEAGLPDDRYFGGPLRTTFLLAMATPMILLPMERILKPTIGVKVAGDERQKDNRLAALINDTFAANKSFGKSPFAGDGDWRYVQNHPLFNTAREWPSKLLRTLNSPEAAKAAMAASTRTIVSNLRNALAHGGIAYLDKNGRQIEGEAAMFAFTSFKTEKGKPVGLNIIRVNEHTFCNFLSTWTVWLKKSGITHSLNRVADPPHQAPAA